MFSRIVKLVLYLPLLWSCISVPRTSDKDHSLPSVTIEGYRYHLQTHGKRSNPTVIILHGGPGGDFNYLRGLSGLSDHYFVVFYDQRGSGLSPRVPGEEITLESSVSDLDKIVNHFSPQEKVILLGHSWGAMLAISYAGRYPKKTSHIIAAEPGMLTRQAARNFVDKMKENQSLADIFFFLGQFMVVPFVKSDDGHERYDYVMTSSLNRNPVGPPYQCPGTSLPEEYFVRAGYEAFANTLMPIMDDPSTFPLDLTVGLDKFQGRVLFLSSECSMIGFKFQEQHHLPLFPTNTTHILVKEKGHNFFTTHPQWSIEQIKGFLAREQ